MTKKTLTLIIAAIAFTATVAHSQENPLWLRKNAISPDGKTIAFSYKGDIFTVPSSGGKAFQLTSNSAYDSDPMWSADSRTVVFSSYREGSRDIFSMPATGGSARRITFLPGDEQPLAVLPDGRILFRTNLQDYPGCGEYPGSRMSQLYISGHEDGEFSMVAPITMPSASVNAAGDLIYEDYKGYEDELRKHHSSSVTRDVWLVRRPAGSEFKFDGKCSFTRLTDFCGEDRNPVFDSDGDTFYYLSEQDGVAMNVFRSRVSEPSRSTQLTFYKKNPVRHLSLSSDGLICYSYNGELYTLREGHEPEKVQITVVRDASKKEKFRLELSGGATAFSASKDGKEMAVAVRGDIFVTSVDYRTTKRITDTPQQERNVCFSPDGRSLYYSSERDGHWAVWKASLKDKDDKLFTYASEIEETMFSDPGQTCFQPLVSPDGKMVAYLRDRTELVVKPAKGGRTRSLLKDVNYSYTDGDQQFSWSPDSKYILSLYQGEGRWHNRDIALINVESGELTNLTLSGYVDAAFKWAMGGRAITWKSDKYGYRSHGSWGSEDDIYIMFLDPSARGDFFMDKEEEERLKPARKEKKDSGDVKKAPKAEFELQGRFDRIRRLTRSSGSYGDYYLTEDARTLYYVTPLEKGRGLCSLDLRDGNVKVVARGLTGSIQASPDGKYLYFNNGSSITRLSVAGGAQKKISYEGSYDFRPGEERDYIFSHVWKQVQEKFYDPALHGVDWDYFKENYSRFLPYIDNDYDFQDLLSEMLGELNGSHTGARYYAQRELPPSYIGITADPDYKGEGVKIKEILPGGPLDLAAPKAAAGDIIVSIDDHIIGKDGRAGTDGGWRNLLAGKSGKKIPVSIKTGGKVAKYYLKPIPSQSQLLYRKWVAQREEMVERLSGGKVGYVHVQGMNSESFREVYSKALGKYRNCEALIVDTRHNGGGWLHDDLADFLSGKSYVDFKPRGQYIGSEPFNKWTKPSCVLVCEDNYSDASGFPYVYRAKGLGKVIGMPVPGTMTAVWWERQVNPAIVFGIPQVGTWGIAEGRYLENLQLEPDLMVENTPASLLDGRDLQLEAAVMEMLK